MNKKIYVAHQGSNDVRELIHGVTIDLGAGAHPSSIALDPTANRLYVAEEALDRLTVIDTTTDTLLTRRPVGDMPRVVRVNPVTHRVYVANVNSDSVSIMDGDTWAVNTIAVGDGPVAMDINTHTNKVYVVNHGGNSVTRIDGATDATRTINLWSGAHPTDVAVNPVTNRIYVTNYDLHTVTVINGASDTMLSTFSLGGASNPVRVAVNPITNKIYVTNWGSNQVSVIDGASNLVSNLPSMGNNPRPLTVNVATNKVYVVNTDTNNLTVIDGARDRIAYAGLTVGVGTLVVVPFLDGAVTVNMAGNSLTSIPCQQNTNLIPLMTTITPLPGHTARGATVRFNFTANSGYTPIAPPVRQIYFQSDTLTGRRLRASPDGASGSGSTSSLTRGLHFVYAFAVDGQEATSVNTGLQSSPIPGFVTFYQFLVTDARLHLPIIVR
ncbi:MAG: YncE family protein [Anaerolineae bacterium]